MMHCTTLNHWLGFSLFCFCVYIGTYTAHVTNKGKLRVNERRKTFPVCPCFLVFNICSYVRCSVSLLSGSVRRVVAIRFVARNRRLQQPRPELPETCICVQRAFSGNRLSIVARVFSRWRRTRHQMHGEVWWQFPLTTWWTYAHFPLFFNPIAPTWPGKNLLDVSDWKLSRALDDCSSTPCNASDLGTFLRFYATIYLVGDF